MHAVSAAQVSHEERNGGAPELFHGKSSEMKDRIFINLSGNSQAFNQQCRNKGMREFRLVCIATGQNVFQNVKKVSGNSDAVNRLNPESVLQQKTLHSN